MQKKVLSSFCISKMSGNLTILISLTGLKMIKKIFQSFYWGLPSNKKLLKNNIKEKHAAINGLRSKNQGSSVAESLSNNSLCLILTSKNAD